jgi:hypothetical protein
MSCRRTCRELVGRTVHHPALPLNPSLCSSVFFLSSAILPSSSSANGAALHHHPSSGLGAHRPWRVAATCSRRPELLQQGAVAQSSVAPPELPVHVEPASFYAQMLQSASALISRLVRSYGEAPFFPLPSPHPAIMPPATCHAMPTTLRFFRAP